MEELEIVFPKPWFVEFQMGLPDLENYTLERIIHCERMMAKA